MDGEIPLRADAQRVGHVVQPGDYRPEMKLVGADATVELIVGECVISHLQAVQCRRAPVTRDTTEEQLAVLPLSADVTVFRAAGQAPVAAAGELDVVVQAGVDDWA